MINHYIFCLLYIEHGLVGRLKFGSAMTLRVSHQNENDFFRTEIRQNLNFEIEFIKTRKH